MAGYNKKIARNYYLKSLARGENDIIAGQKRFLKALNQPLKNKVVLDAGCGFGCTSDLLNKRGAKVLGIDSSLELIKIAKEKYPSLSPSFMVASVEKLPFRDNFFDVIISKYILHYLNNPDLAFKEFYRCLKHNGVLLFSVHHPVSSFFFKKNKDYLKKEKIRVNILRGVRVVQSSHNLTDYLSKYFLKHFNVLSIQEGRGSIILSRRFKIPEYLLIKAQKRKT